MPFPVIDSAARGWRTVLNSYPGWLAAALLALMFVLGVTSLRNDSAVFDEVAHIPAGYAYVHYGDYRLNPEHPPLMKDLAGLPLQFMNLKFPDQEDSWTTEMNGQWTTGRRFLYTIGNDANAILFWSRLPILLVAIGFGCFLYVWSRSRWGAPTALLALFFYVLSPNVLAHAQYVTTDIGASATLFLVLVAFVRFVERPRWPNVALLAIALGTAQLVKFSAFTIYPFLAGVTVVVLALWSEPGTLAARIRVYVGGLLIGSLASGVLVWAVYALHTRNMPIAVQDRLIVGSMIPGTLEPLAHRLLVINKLPLMKPIVQYLIGVTMVLARVKIGTWTYFNGHVIRGSFRGFFPEIFVLKTQVAFLLLGLAGVYTWLRRPEAPGRFASLSSFALQLRQHLALWVLAGFAAFYFGLAVLGNLNLGVRHILPIYAPLFVLVAVGVVRLTQKLSSLRSARVRSAMLAAVAGLLAWYAGSTLAVHPAYTAYFNELIGGPSNGDAYFADSSIDWGQDLRRLRAYVDAHPEIQHLAVDYFGGGEVKYYFCNHSASLGPEGNYDCRGSAYDEWRAADGPYTGQYLAVSETNLARDPLFGQHYQYLRNLTPIAKVGYSIEVFKLR